MTMDDQEKDKWYELARVSVPGESNETIDSPPPPYGLEFGRLSAASSEQNTLQGDLSNRRLSELSDSQLNEYINQQRQLLSSMDDSNVDFKVDTFQDSGVVSSGDKKHSGIRPNLQERIDGEISEGNHNVYFDSNLSPISLIDDDDDSRAGAPATDINDTTMLLQRAHEANCLFSTKEGDGSVEDTEWHSLQSNMMQVISRPEPIGYARCDTGNVTGNKSVTFANDAPLVYSDVAHNGSTDEFLPLENTPLLDDSNGELKQKLGRRSDLFRTPVSDKHTDTKSMRYDVGNKIVSFGAKYDGDKGDKGDNNKHKSTVNTSVGMVAKDSDNKNGGNVSDKNVDDEDSPDILKRLVATSLTNLNISENYLIKDEYVSRKTDLQPDSQGSEVLFVPSFTSGENQSVPESLLLQSLSDTSNNSLKSDIQRLFMKDVPTSLGNESTNNSLLAFTKTKDYESFSDIGAGESGNVSLDSTVRKKLAFSGKKKKGHNVTKDEFRTSKPNLTSSVKSGSYSISSSLESSLNSGSFCIRKIIDEKIEIRNVGQYTGAPSNDSVLTNSQGAGVIPQFSLTSLSSVEEKSSNLNSEDGTLPSNLNSEDGTLPLNLNSENGTLPSYASSYSNPSFQPIPGKHNSPVSRLLGSTFKKTEDFLKKLEKLELPHLNRNLGRDYKVDSNLLTSNQTLPSITHGDKSNVDSGLHEDRSDTKYDDGGHDTAQQSSDDESLAEQDIESASLMEPFISDTTLQSGSRDESCLPQLYKRKLLSSDSSKASDLQAISEGELTITDLDLELDKCSNPTNTSMSCKSLGTIAPTSVNLETITEISSPEKGKNENNALPVVVDQVKPPREAAPPHVTKSQNIEERVEKKIVYAISTSSESDDPNMKVKRFVKHLSDHKSKMANAGNARSMKDTDRNPVSLFDQPPDFGRKKNAVDGTAYSVPCEFSALRKAYHNSPDNTSSDEYIVLREGNSSKRVISHNTSNRRDEHTPRYSMTALDKSMRKGCSRSEVLENTLNKLLYEYEKPVPDKFSESPLLKKLELLSKILQDAKNKRFNSYTSSDASEKSVNLSENQASTLDMNKKKQSNSHKIPSHNGSSLLNLKSLKPSSTALTSAHSKASIDSAPNEKSSIPVCSNCRRRDVGTNYPTPRESSDEGSHKSQSKPLTLQTWTQTNEITADTSNENEKMCRKVAPARKRWSVQESNTEIESTNIEHVKDEEKIGNNGGKRERKNTFVLDHPLQDLTVESNSLEEKGKGSTAWFLSFASDDSHNMALEDVPDLNTAYLESRENPNHIGPQYERSDTDTRLGLQQAFLLHKKEFIKESNQRVQGIKDACLEEKHQLRPKLKTIRVEIHKERKPKKKVPRVRKPVAMPKPAWVPKKFNYNEMIEEKLREKRSNRLKMKNYDQKLRERFLKRRTPNSRKNIYFLERH